MEPGAGIARQSADGPAERARSPLVSVARAPAAGVSEVARAERELLARLRAGEPNAFDVFAVTYVPALYRFAAARMSGDLDRVSDVVQGALAKAIAALDGFRGEAALFTWLCACCRNEIAGHYRRRSRRPVELALDELAAAGDAEPAVAADAEDRLLRLESAERVHAALDLLPERYARALGWKYLEGVPVGEVARRLDTSEKAAESLLGRARAAFRDAYRHLEEPPPRPARRSEDGP
jgi:RNA polymerase sigma-70 factor (ECF subfamily)